jgi:hypothetical protein
MLTPSQFHHAADLLLDNLTEPDRSGPADVLALVEGLRAMASESVPPIYDPGISENVAACAERIAAEYLSRRRDLYVDDTPALYRIVRATMDRRVAVSVTRPTLDDESISAGIVRAINAA